MADEIPISGLPGAVSWASTDLTVIVQGGITKKANSSLLSGVGTLTTGTWNATIVTGTYGGTGIANTGLTITLASGATGKILQSDVSGNAAYSTAAYPVSTSANQILYSSGDNVVTGLTTTARSILTLNSTSVPTYIALTNGQLVVGSTAGSPAAASITGSGNISVTNGSNTIALSVTGTASLSFSAITTNQALVVNTGVIVTSGALSLSLPATAAVGSIFYVILSGGTSWTITQGVGQQIRMGSVSTTSGVGGSLASSAQGDAIYFVCDVANLHFVAATGTQGNITVV